MTVTIWVPDVLVTTNVVLGGGAEVEVMVGVSGTDDDDIDELDVLVVSRGGLEIEGGEEVDRGGGGLDGGDEEDEGGGGGGVVVGGGVVLGGGVEAGDEEVLTDVGGDLQEQNLCWIK